LKQIRRHLTYANVMSSFAVFLILGGATAFAAKKIGPNQLKANSVKTGKIVKEAVTTAKVKKNAVTTDKLRDGAVDSAKIADGSVTTADINLGSAPFSRIIAKFRGNSSVEVPGGSAFVSYPLGNPTYVQGPDELNAYYAGVDVTFQPGCTAPRSAAAYVLVDPADPSKPLSGEIAALGVTEDTAGGTVSKRIDAGPYFGSKFEPGSAKNRTVSIAVTRSCTAGSGVTATFGGVDVVGTK
jgi:hypothetical protein